MITVVDIQAVSLSDLQQIIQKVAWCVNTPMLPTDEMSFYSVRDLANSWMKKNFSRKFTEGFDEAHLGFVMTDHNFLFEYHSTSDTRLHICINFDSHQNIDTIQVVIQLPEERAKAGRLHYDTLVNAFAASMSRRASRAKRFVAS